MDMNILVPALRLLGILWVIGGLLLMVGIFNSRDEQAVMSGGVVQSSVERARWAPGWGLLLFGAGGGLVFAAARLRRRP